VPRRRVGKGLCPFSNHVAKGDNRRTEAESGDATSKGEPEAAAGRKSAAQANGGPPRGSAPRSPLRVRIAPRRHGWPAETGHAAGLPWASEKTASAGPATAAVSSLGAQFCAG